MTAEYQLAFVYPAAFALLPPPMDTPAARALLLAIALQESKFIDRCQVLDSGARGPARGWYQFELGGGVIGVLSHKSTRAIALQVLDVLRYSPAPKDCLAALEHNDILAACFARLLLWTASGALPGPADIDQAWDLYVDCWHPGKPHQSTWGPYYARAWSLVDGE